MDIKLVMFKDGERRDFALTPGDTIIGRRQDCTLRIQTGDVSRKHCKITVGQSSALIEDLESANGTYVNGERITDQRLKAGDKIKIGPAVFVVQIDGEPTEISPEDTAIDLVELGEGASDQVTRAEPADQPAKQPKQAQPQDDEHELTEDDLFELSDDDMESDDPLAAMEAILDEEDEEDEEKSK